MPNWGLVPFNRAAGIAWDGLWGRIARGSAVFGFTLMAALANFPHILDALPLLEVGRWLFFVGFIGWISIFLWHLFFPGPRIVPEFLYAYISSPGAEDRNGRGAFLLIEAALQYTNRAGVPVALKDISVSLSVGNETVQVQPYLLDVGQLYITIQEETATAAIGVNAKACGALYGSARLARPREVSRISGELTVICTDETGESVTISKRISGKDHPNPRRAWPCLRLKLLHVHGTIS